MTDREIIIFERDDGLWDWHVVAPNGEVVYGSLQGFSQRGDALEAALRENPDLPVKETDGR
jgi:uncharacterized protein YegP (UPF0339 family)